MSMIPKREDVQALIDRWVDLRGPERAWSKVGKELGADDKKLKRYVNEFAKVYRIKVPDRTFDRLTTAQKIQVENDISQGREPLQIIRAPSLPQSDLPLPDLIKHLTKRAELKIAHYDARRWIECPVLVDGPIGLAMIGDPHVDDDGCDWPTLNEHLDIFDKHPHILTAGLGDYSNNWVGRLAHLYADQGTTAKQAWQLVGWLIGRLRPFLLIKGNHDLWSGPGDPLDFMTTPGTITSEWQARISLKFPNGAECRIISAHDFPGHSMWNDLHANQRKAKMSGARAHIYVAGHRHTWGCAEHEDPESNHVYWLARARGYKVIDSYAEQKGYLSQRHGHTITAIIDPDKFGTPGFVHCFSDLRDAADYLKWKRQRRKAA
jgi:hypothetical protein